MAVHGANKTCVITYFGLDGACSAAAALAAFPGALVLASSAARIGETLRELVVQEFDEVHVCGVGVNCDWDLLATAALALREQGCRLHWHCGRDYLREQEERMAKFCAPAFLSAGTNTAAIIRSLGLADSSGARFLVDLAHRDKHLGDLAHGSQTPADQIEWIDFIEASISHYFKYLDRDAYVRAIHKLARRERDAKDRDLVDVFRRTGYRYMLHGMSPATRELKRRIQRCAEINRPVIITGESGVGKEHVAHLLWEGGAQARGPFVPVNCASFAGNSNLANSDLFGHRKGAFTGAVTNRPGRFAEADTGILFLDELGELPLEVQAKLLRVIEDGWVTPEGADKPETQVKVRIVAATNTNLSQAIREGKFRTDLYHRIAALRIHVPPLRERLEDIPRIVTERLAALEREGYPLSLNKASYKALERYSWPGNVRQLLKILDRAALLAMSVEEAIREEESSGEALQYRDHNEDPSHLRFPVDPDHIVSMRELQRRYATHVWELCGRNYAAAARRLDVTANTLRYNYLRVD